MIKQILLITLLSLISIKSYAVNLPVVNYPELQGQTVSGPVLMCSNGPCTINQTPDTLAIQPITVTAPRLDENGNPIKPVVRIPLTTDPVKQPPPPSGVPATIPHSTAAEIGCYLTGGPGESTATFWGGSSTSAQSACNLACASKGGQFFLGSSFCSNTPASPQGYGWRINTTSREQPCPAGYTQSGSNCNLTNAKLAKPDNIQDFKANANGGSPTYTPDDDADNNSPDKYPLDQPSPDTINLGTIDGSGRPVQISAQITPTGTKVNVQNQVADGNGNSYVKNTQYNYNTSGQYVGEQSTSAPGSLQSGGSNGTYTPSTGTANPVQFPNDYAKTGEAQSAANSINGKLDTIHNDLTNTNNAADGSGTEPSYDSGLDTSFEGLKGWQLPVHTSTCPTGSFNAFSHTFTLDAQCTVMEQVKPTLSIAMIAVWLIAALFLILST